MWDEIIGTLIDTLTPILVSLLVALIGYGVAYLRKRIAALDQAVARASLDAALAEAEKVAIDAVRATNQVLVDGLKKAREDGKLTTEEAQQALEMAKNYFLSQISKDSLQILNAALGPVEEWLSGMIEAKVAEVKGVKAQVQALARPNS